ncbi:MAG TPA: dihydrolipoamide acetyltransferase family protein [Ktedonobacterales bacterium]|jgi:2-oxoisovalerate dehydrogenase E2 component (dihydrolipoyl transacylase)|nr:dihydrolipoamide acetyltransferase family protein [Ktedonobacterales bacterium]
MTTSQFRLPDLGEGLEEAQLVQWLVRPGETIALNQPLCQVETAKALVDVPSPYAGVVRTLHAQPGETVPVGAPLVTIETSDAGATSAAPANESAGPVLVGYGTEGPAQTFTRRRRGVEASTAPVVPQSAVTPQTASAPATNGADAKASPLVRKIAQERGVNLATITGTGPGGRIRVEDLDAVPAQPAKPATPLSDDEERISTVGLRKAIAAKMVRAATTIPHFTEYALFDAAGLVGLRDQLKGRGEYAETRLTFLPFLVVALARAVREYPIMNSRWDEEGSAIIVKHSVHIGVATDTERGLVVPVIHDAHTLTLAQVAAETDRLTQLARAGKLEARMMTGGTITVTNVGAAGPVDTGAPLINLPEACVVGFGAIKKRPMAVGEQVLVRPSAWISMSCDHRIVDGATAAKFIGRLVNLLEDPDALAQ